MSFAWIDRYDSNTANVDQCSGVFLRAVLEVVTIEN